jgi:hypothetical protein
MRPILLIQSEKELPTAEIEKIHNGLYDSAIGDDYHILVIQPHFKVEVLNPVSETYEENTIIDSEN